MAESRRRSQGELVGAVAVMAQMCDSLADYQERHGIPNENYTFLSLMSILLSLGGQAFSEVFSMAISLVPVTDIALHLARFILEVSLDIVDTNDSKEVALKLITALAVVIFVFGSILFPIWIMCIAMTTKIMYFVMGQPTPQLSWETTHNN